MDQKNGSTPHQNPYFGTTFPNPLIIRKKNGSIKFVLDTTHRNSDTDKSSESWPLALLAKQLALTTKNYNSAIDFIYTYAHATFDDETKNLTAFSSGDKIFAFIGRVYGFIGFRHAFTQQFFFQRTDPTRICPGLIWRYLTHVKLKNRYAATYQTTT